VQADGESALLAWHTLGSVQPERLECHACGGAYEADDETAELSACPACGTADTWEARQGEAFRRLVGEIDACPSLAKLAVLGKRLYAARLPHDQAGVAWTHYRFRKAALEHSMPLGAPARALLAEVEQAPVAALSRLGVRLYRLQHGTATSIAASEWRRIWQTYHSRRRAAA
jgi:hypothetical protein